jgi:quercetin dioxygenase-like cupin family protein
MNKNIKTIGISRHSNLKDVSIRPMWYEAKAGFLQEVLVVAEAGAIIPLHTHKVDARMFIVAGSGYVLSVDENNGTPVSVGMEVFFEKDKAHGFRAGTNGLTFVSRNGGIVDNNEKSWDISFS